MLGCKSSSSPLKTMEEVWKDINLSSLHHNHHRSTSSTTTTSQTFHFQDFFSKPSFPYNDPPPPNDLSSAGDTISLGLGSLPKRSSSSAASLSLKSKSESELGVRFLESSAPALDFSPAFNKTRVQQNGHDLSDLKHKRLMKNRESAARSRARKQAYTNELEHEVARLRKENANLKNQLTEFHLGAQREVPKKRSLCRTLTAPF